MHLFDPLICSVELELLPSSHESSVRQHDNPEMENFSRGESTAIAISIFLVLGLTVIVAWLVFAHVEG